MIGIQFGNYKDNTLDFMKRVVEHGFQIRKVIFHSFLRYKEGEKVAREGGRVEIHPGHPLPYPDNAGKKNAGRGEG